MIWAARLRQAAVLLRRAFGGYRADHCQQMAAAISFHVLFAVFPLAIAAVAIIGLVTHDPHARDAVLTAVLKAVPLSAHGKQQLQQLLTSVSGGVAALGLLGLLGAAWSASGLMTAIRTALNMAWHSSQQRPFLHGKAVDLALVVGAFLVTGATLGLTLAASIARHLPGPLQSLAPLAGAAASAGVYLASAALLFATFGFLYRFVPAAPTRIRGIWPGALAAAAGFETLQYGFSAYIAHFAHYNKVYGSLGAVIAFLSFIYLASMIFLFGAEIASEYPRLRTQASTTTTGGAGGPGAQPQTPGTRVPPAPGNQAPGPAPPHR